MDITSITRQELELTIATLEHQIADSNLYKTLSMLRERLAELEKLASPQQTPEVEKTTSKK